MYRIIIALVLGCILTLLDIYPVYSRLLPVLESVKKTRYMTGTIVNMVVEISSPSRNAQVIKSPEDALTISRFYQDGKVHTLAVLEDDGERVTGVDLSAELNRYEQHSFDVIKNIEFNELVKLIRACSKKLVVKYEDLLPGVAGDKHMAIGINYAEHGKETGQVRPFMFPKYVDTDPAIHCLNYSQGWLLDHEVELGIVFSSPVCAVADLDHVMIGFLVVNDFTDRATLMRQMDSKNVTGGKGFPDAKSKKGFLPTGPYMVIPRDWRAFVAELQLNLSVNGKVRQNGSAKNMVWNIDKIIENSLAVKGEKKSFYQDKMVRLFEGECIPANSIIITGTPSGVVFNAPTKGFIFGTVTKYIFTAAFLQAKMHPYILCQYLKKEMTNPRYLKPGDQVQSAISFLGSIKTSVKE